MLSQGIEGSIVNMSSQMGHVGSPNRSVYCMTKHAIEGLTKAMAVELAPKGIRGGVSGSAILALYLVSAMFSYFVQGDLKREAKMMVAQQRAG